MVTRNYTSPKFRYEQWQPQYEAAVLELDPNNLSQRVAEAEAAILKRLQTLSVTSGDELEREAIQNALDILRFLISGNAKGPE